MRSTLALLFAVATTPAAAIEVKLPDWATVEIVTHDLGHGVYMLEGFGGNIGVLAGADGVVLVDDQYAPLTPKVLAALKDISDQPVRFVLNTHWHPDHVGGNDNLGRAGVVIVAQDRTREFMIAAQDFDGLKDVFTATAMPIVTFTDDISFHINGVTAHAFHIPPAHTAGDAVVHFVEADVIHTGDAYFNGFYPFIDVDSGGSIDGMIALCDRLLEMAGPDTRVIPGHGAVATRDDVARYRAMLVKVRERVAAALGEGLSLADLIARAPLADLDPEYGGNLVKAPDLLEYVYRDLAAR